jgi:hypothetical protein
VLSKLGDTNPAMPTITKTTPRSLQTVFAMTFSFSCETVNASCGHAQLEKRAAAVELRGMSSENGADCITTGALAVKVFCAELIYRRIEPCFRGVYTANILGEMPDIE